MPAQVLHRALGVEHQVLLVVHVDVVRFPVGEQQDQLVGHAPAVQEVTGVAQSRAHTRRQLAAHAGKACFRLLAIGLSKSLKR